MQVFEFFRWVSGLDSGEGNSSSLKDDLLCDLWGSSEIIGLSSNELDEGSGGFCLGCEDPGFCGWDDRIFGLFGFIIIIIQFRICFRVDLVLGVGVGVGAGAGVGDGVKVKFWG